MPSLTSPSKRPRSLSSFRDNHNTDHVDQKLPRLEQNPTVRPSAASPSLASPTASVALPNTTTTTTTATTSSSSSKKKSVSGASGRTGQACDRCKTRKIRCDDTQGGCMPCRQNSTKCVTTDRITQRANVRGHTEHIEQDNAALKSQLRELQQQLREHGIEPKTPTFDLDSNDSYDAPPRSPSVNNHESSRKSSSGASKIESHSKETSETRSFPDQQTLGPGCANGKNYLGVTSENSHLSHIKGTSMSVFGMEVDLADYISDDSDGPMSYSAVMSSMITNKPPSMKPPPLAGLPPYENTHWSADAYIRLMNPWMPVLHKPDFMALIKRFFKPNYRPTNAEIVMIQMVFAILKYQNYVRNSDGSDSYKQVRDQSFAHFHYALSHVYTLTSSRRTEDMQALAMFCIHLRYFPKPGPAWMITGWFLSMCIEMGMHRSAKCCTGQESKKDLISIEMQKRVFWTLLSLHVQASGKMGRPMLLRSEDFDVDFPQAIPDGLGAEAGKPPGQTCSIWPAIEVFKLTHLLLDTYNTIYTIKPAPDYDGTIHQLEQRAQQWRDQLPTLSNHENEDPNCDPNAPVFALWIKFWDAEMQLLMHHPALCRTQAPEVKAANLQKCLDAAWNIIDMSASARRKKVLDTTWQNTTTFVAAIFTLLFGFWNRRHQITKADFARLRRQMDVCLDILEELGRMLGSSGRLRDKIRDIIDAGLGHINRFLVESTATAAVANAGAKQAPNPQYNTPAARDPGYDAQVYSQQFGGANDAGPTMRRPSHGIQKQESPPHTQLSEYQQAINPHAYHDAHSGSESREVPFTPNMHSRNVPAPPLGSGGNNYNGMLDNNFATASSQPAAQMSSPNMPPYAFNGQMGHYYSDYSPQSSWQRFTESLKGGAESGQQEHQSIPMHPASFMNTPHGLMHIGMGGHHANGVGPGHQVPSHLAGQMAANGPTAGGSVVPHPVPGMTYSYQTVPPSNAPGWPFSAGYDLETSGFRTQ